jgi:putative tryptophan/tyrosine transport system substrate-binding protein
MRRRELMAVLGGAAAAWPFALRAEEKAMPVIGWLAAGSPGPRSPALVAAFRQGLSQAGYVEGQNIRIEYRWAEGNYDRLPALAADLVGHNVAVIIATTVTPALAAKNATSTIPIVFESGVDPVSASLVASFGHPGGNLTGVSVLSVELMPKRLELLSDLVPQARLIALLINPTNSNFERIIRLTQEAAQAKRMQFAIVKAATESEIDGAFTSLVELHADALVIGADGFLYSQREQIAGLASRHAVPAIGEAREVTAAGVLVSYGASQPDVSRQLGIYAGKILKGAKPADLPVEQPTKYELVINLKTAKELGLNVPQSLLAQADEVIE